MAIVIGGGTGLSWSAAVDKVRGDLWRTGTSGVPTDVGNRALHASIRELEGERRWLWLENVQAALTMDGADDNITVGTSVQSVARLSYRYGSFLDPVERAPLSTVRELASGLVSGKPSFYALTDGGLIYFDTTVPDQAEFELIFTARCPPYLDDAIEAPSVTMELHQQAVIANACYYVALTYLKNEAEAARQRAAYERQLDVLMNIEDQQRSDEWGGGIVPDTTYHVAAYGHG